MTPTPVSTSIAVGTGAYMSPEQVQSRHIDARSDLYSAAIVFYETLAGRPPFSPDEMNEFSLRQAQVEAAPPTTGHLRRRRCPSNRAACSRGPWQRTRKYRFASALELGDAIRVALNERDTDEWNMQRAIGAEARRRCPKDGGKRRA